MDFYSMLQNVETFFWGYIGFVLIIFLGSFLTLRTKGYQILALPFVCKKVGEDMIARHDERGYHPLRLFFTSVGGMLGVGNIIGIVTAVQLGGPGALFWVWVAGFAGSLIKYSEIYLGLKHRVQNESGGYDGGPMYFLRRAFKMPWIASLVALLLCIYGAEIYQFNVVVDTLSSAIQLDRLVIAVLLLSLVMYTVLGGIRRVSSVCSIVMPLFLAGYLVMGFWVILMHATSLPGLFDLILTSAFNGHAAAGGFIGSTAILAIQNGMASASYAADIGIGYDSIIQAESKAIKPEVQARLAFLGVIMDNIICTVSILIVLVTGLWQQNGHEMPLVQTALNQYFPFMNWVMPLFIFLLGYTTLIAYLLVGCKCASYLHPKSGSKIYISYALLAFGFFHFYDQNIALTVMRIAGAMLLMINLTGIFLLRKEIFFERSPMEAYGTAN